MDYAIIDVETSGGKFNEESIIEIAVYRFNGEKITDTFISLVNPEKEIHYFVQKLTGITPKMVKTAPKFYELAKRLIEITDETTIVAHNADFDYRVICSEFSRLGYEFIRPTLDTISLSKSLIPGMPSYSLGNLCSSLGIPLSDRHRAHGDARATVKLFQILLDKDSHKNIIQSSIKNTKYPSYRKKLQLILENIPQETGVFYLHNEEGKIIYLDKSSNMANKARLALTGKDKKSKELQTKVDEVSFELTGNEIIACLKSAEEAKSIKPEVKLKRELDTSIYGVFLSADKTQLIAEALTKKNKKSALFTFHSLHNAENFITNLQQESEGEFSVQNFIAQTKLKEEHLLLIGTGRTLGEKSFILLEKGVIKGYGFYTLHSQIKNLERIYKIMIPAKGSPKIVLMIRNKLFVTKKLSKMVIEESNLLF